MADIKISQLPAATTPLAGTEEVPLVQSGTTKKTTVADIAAKAGAVTAVTGTAPVVSSGGSTPAISMPAATSSVNGYLTSADWTTFNAKQPAGSYLVNGGALGTPSSGTATNLTGLPLSTGVTGTLPVLNGGTGVTTSTGSGSVVLSTSPTLVTPALGTPASGNFSSGTFTWPTFNQNTTGTAAGLSATLAIASGGTAATTAAAAIQNLLPSYTGNGNKRLGLNSGATALEWTTDGGGTVTSVGGTGTVSGISLSGTVTTSGNLTLGGTLDLSAYNGAGAFTTLSASGAVTLSGGTANGVAYLNGSKVLTTGSALTFDGTTLVSGSGIRANSFMEIRSNTAALYWENAANTLYWSQNLTGSDFAWNYYNGSSNTEQMRLTSTGLGIGTSSPASRLTVEPQSGSANTLTIRKTGVTSFASFGAYSDANGPAYFLGANLSFTSGGSASRPDTSYAAWDINMDCRSTNTAIVFEYYNTAGTYFERMRLDSSGNLGLGVTPSAWFTGSSVFQFGATGSVWNNGSNNSAFSHNMRFTDVDARYLQNGLASYYAQTSGLHIWYNAPSGTAGAVATFTEVMRLDASGNLGVGTTSPDIFARGYTRSLGVTSSGSTSIAVNGTSGGYLDVGFNGTRYGQIASLSANDFSISGIGASTFISFLTNFNERARITSGGDLLVGKTSAGLSGTGTFVTSTGRVNVVTAATTNAFSTYELFSSGVGAYRFYVDASGTISATSIVISAISDQRLKENVRDIDTGLDSIMALKPRRFDWKEGKGQDKKNVAGFIAQEFETVFPECVGTSLAGADGVKYKNINHETLIPTLVKAIQEQQAIIQTLTARVAALESN